MFSLPPVPSWDSLHPLVIHIPIGLLLIAPLFVVIGAVLPPAKGRSYLMAALLLMVIGTVSVFVAVETGEAGGKLVERTPEITTMLQRHEQFAEQTQFVFSVLTGAFAAIVALPFVLRRMPKRVPERVFTTWLPLALLVAYAGGALLLINTGHHGGMLVHQLGVHAMLS